MKWLYILIPIVICSPFNYLGLTPSSYYSKFNQEKNSIYNIENKSHISSDEEKRNLMHDADSIIVRFNFLDNTQFILTQTNTIIENDGQRKMESPTNPSNELFRLGTNLFVENIYDPILATYIQQSGVISDSPERPEVSITTWKNNNLYIKSFNLNEWSYQTRTIFSIYFKKFINHLLKLKEEPNSHNNKYKSIDYFSDTMEYENYPNDYKPYYLMIRYFNDVSKNSYHSLSINNDKMGIYKYSLSSEQTNKLLKEHLISVPIDSTLYQLTLELFYTKKIPFIKNQKIGKYNKHPKELLDVINENFEGFNGFIDTHVEDQIIEYSPEFNEFMDRLRKLIEKAEKESK